MGNDNQTKDWKSVYYPFELNYPGDYVGSPLRFKNKRIINAFNEIKNFSNKSKYLNVVDEDWDVWPDRQYSFISIYLKINNKLNHELNKIFNDDWDFDRGKRVQFINPRWERNEENIKYWYYGRRSRPLCGDNYRDVIFDEDYSKCHCPKEFINNICRPINDIIKKHALKQK